MTSFSDDFNRADSSNLGVNWVEVSGDWSIVSQQLSPGSAGGTIILRAAGAMASDDNFAQATIAATTAASHGVWCRGNSNISSGYLFRNDGTSWDLFSVVGGSFTSLGSYAAAAAPGDVVKLQAVGSAIKGYVNGIERVSVTNTHVTTGTSVGIRSESTSSIRFDDFSAGDVVFGATLGVAAEVDTAQTLTGAKTATLTAAGETSTAQPLAGAKTAALTPAAEVDTAQALVGAKGAVLGVAGSVEAAQPLSGAKSATLTPAVEQDAAQALVGTVTATLGTAGTVESARPLTGAKSAVLPVALEISTARPLTAQSSVVPSPERTFTIPAEGRRLTVVAETRTLTVR